MGITKYYESISNAYPILSKEEEKEVLAVYYGHDTSEEDRSKARDRIIGSNLRYVFKTAKRHARGNVEQFEELIAAGNEGLMVGLEKFDNTSGNRFLTYAGWWVLQRMLREMSKWRLVALPAQKQQLATKIKRFIDNSEEFPTIDELKEEFPKASEKDLHELSQTQYITFYLDSIKASETPLINPIDEIIDKSEDDYLNQQVNLLPDQHAKVISMTYGLEDGVERRPGEIAKATGLTINQVKVVQEEALEKLRHGYTTT